MTVPETQQRAMQRIRADVRAMSAYHVQPAQGLLKMDTMENPFRLPAALQQALGARLGALEINRYPGERLDVLKQMLADYAGAPAGSAVLLGNGSDEIITLLALATAQPTEGGRATMLAPMPGFVMYPLSAQLQGLDFVGVNLTPDFELDLPAMQAAIAQHRPAITYIAYPNNPTATLWPEDQVQAVIDAVGAIGGLVVMDEAYQPFASRSWIRNMQADPARNAHVLLMRTLSKFGLAGARLGYLIGPAALVNELDKVRPPYNISVLNCETAIFALEHAALYAEQAAAIRAERLPLIDALTALDGVDKVWPSEANMVLLRVRNAAAAQAAMKARGVLVKNVSAMHPLLANCLRLTVGTREENAQMLAALKESL
ncbi:histidinol-phosphate transaminase [Comamonas sp. CAH-2]|uniref:histidinol-phosphate transaminase n=1 Tax=Comamonas sp. CAH-2 TaxID=2605745 RepID=UPI0012AE3616|nr:histidinol-phosphate transaminase [Comamonas sp. CAH-2]MRT21777.1 histidinol-phosphate transaminase [Comamonas sp. CAH-2]